MYDWFINDIKAFYENLGIINFKTITSKRLEELKEIGLKLNKTILNNDHLGITFPKRYAKIMEKLRISPQVLNINTKDEMAAVLIYAVDPEFEAYTYLQESNKIQELKTKMTNKYGVFDTILIKLEKNYIETIMPDMEKEVLNEKVNKRIWK